ncbi:MAG: pentapeptide repeat-containing protein, partial [Solirubrobacterales bacterium]|nr:pentapeptide repeat-containing protein [Solirubrobacterales bacterium]
MTAPSNTSPRSASPNLGNRFSLRGRRAAPLLLAALISFGAAQAAGQGTAAAEFGSGPEWSQSEYTRCGGLSNGSYEGLVTRSVWSVKPGVQWRAASLFCIAADHATQLVKAHLSGALITRSNLHNVNLAGADLSGATLVESNFQRANLKGANFTDAIFGPELTDEQKAFIKNAKNGWRKHLLKSRKVGTAIAKGNGVFGAGCTAGVLPKAVCSRFKMAYDETQSIIDEAIIKYDKAGRLQSITNSWNDLFNPADGLMSDSMKAMQFKDSNGVGQWWSLQPGSQASMDLGIQDSALDTPDEIIKRGNKIQSLSKNLDEQLERWKMLDTSRGAGGLTAGERQTFEQVIRIKADVDALAQKNSDQIYSSFNRESMASAKVDADAAKAELASARELLEENAGLKNDPYFAASYKNYLLAVTKSDGASKVVSKWETAALRAIARGEGDALVINGVPQVLEEVVDGFSMDVAKLSPLRIAPPSGLLNKLRSAASGSLAKVGGKLLEAPFSIIQLDKAIPDSVMFPHLDFSDADLSGTNFTGATLNSPDFKRTNLSGATMVETAILGADIEGTDFGTDGGTISGIYARNLEGTPSRLPVGWQIENGALIGPGANLEGADLSGLDLSGINLSGADLTDADLGETNLTGANLLLATLAGANLSGTNLKDAIVEGVDLSASDSSDVVLNGVKTGGLKGEFATVPEGWSLVNGPANGSLVGPGADLTGADLTGVDLVGRWLVGANFTNALLTGANLTDSQLQGGIFSGVSGQGVTGAEAISSGSVINGRFIADHPDLRGANLDGVDLSNIDLTGARSGGITGTPTALPTNWHLVSGFLIGPGADLSGANLGGVDLRDVLPALETFQTTECWQEPSPCNRSRWVHDDGYKVVTRDQPAGLISTKSGGITGTPMLPSGWQVANGYLVGPYADLTGADLTGTSLAGGSLNWADFTNANFTNANLRNANLTNVDFGSRRKSPSGMEGLQSGGVTATPGHFYLPDGWVLASGYLIGPGAHPTGDLKGGMDLTGADLSGASLSGSGTTGTWIGPVKWSQRPAVLPSGYQFVNGGGEGGYQPTDNTYLIGPGADLSGAEISCVGDYAESQGLTYFKKIVGMADVNTVTRPNIVPSGTSLQGVNFTGAKIRYCDFDGVNLINANFHNAVGDYLKFTLDTNLFGTSFRNADMTTSTSLIINADTSDADLTGVKVSYNRESRRVLLHLRALACRADITFGYAYWSQKFCDNWWRETADLRVYHGCNDFWDCFGSGFHLDDVDRGKIQDLPITMPDNVREISLDPPGSRLASILSSVIPIIIEAVAEGGVAGALIGTGQALLEGFTHPGFTLDSGASEAPTNVRAVPLQTPPDSAPEDRNWVDYGTRFDTGSWMTVSLTPPKFAGSAVSGYRISLCRPNDIYACAPTAAYTYNSSGTVQVPDIMGDPAGFRLRVQACNERGKCGPYSDPSPVTQ